MKTTIVLAIAFSLSAVPVLAKPPVHYIASKLSRIFTKDMLEAQVSYLEAITGPAWKVEGSVRTYKVDGCVVTVKTNDNDIRSLGLDLTDKCSFSIQAFLNNNYKLPTANKITFGDLSQISINGGKFYGECMPVNCGNAADPLVTAHYEMPHSENFLEINAEVNYTNDAALDVEESWRDRIAAQTGEDPPPDDAYNCPSNDFNRSIAANVFPQNAFKALKITSITIGYNLDTPKCRA